MPTIINLDEFRESKEPHRLLRAVCSTCCWDGKCVIHEDATMNQLECPECGNFTLGVLDMSAFLDECHLFCEEDE